MSKPIDWAACERLVGSLASKFHQDGLELDDLKQEARLAVIQSHAAYSPDTGVSYNTFIGRRIRDALRSFVASNSDTVELEREWVAESIADGPSCSLRAKTKEECEQLRNARGAHLYKKPRRVIETARATLSLDVEDSGDDVSSLHDRVGTGPEQEVGVLEKELSNKVVAKIRKKDTAAEIFRLRNEGRTFEEIAEILGKPRSTVFNTYNRAQKKLNKKAA